MDRTGKFLGQGAIYPPLPLDTTKAGKDRRLDDDGEMALAALAVPGMAMVFFGVVDYIQPAWREGGLKLAADRLGHGAHSDRPI